MKDQKDKFPRGSEWRIWDFHVHTPASFHWDGERFERDMHTLEVLENERNNRIIDEMINAMNESKVAVFVLMDYWTFDGWFALRRRLKNENSPKLIKKVFPGIELRLNSPAKIRLNAHAVFSDKETDQTLRDFLSKLEVSLVDKPLSNESIIKYAKKAGDDKLEKHGISPLIIECGGEDALICASKIVDITAESYKNAMESCGAIGFMPFDTSDGLSEVKWDENYSYFLSLFSGSPIFESRKQETRDMLLLNETAKNKAFIGNVKKGLNNIPRLVVSGSDAHCFIGTEGSNDKRGYGQFPSGKATWIKADPTFKGLLQVIKEPAKRSFIGEEPPKISETRYEQSYFIDSLHMSSCEEIGKNKWFDGCQIEFNSDLVAIIGSKGSGKSALADIISLIGSSKQQDNFSFLHGERFLSSKFKNAYEGILKFKDGESLPKRFNSRIEDSEYERVQYISQGYFEKICVHLEERNLFGVELNKVIFSYIPTEERNGATTFEELDGIHNKRHINKLDSLRAELREVNREIVEKEALLDPENRKTFINQKIVLEIELENCNKIKPAEVPNPGTISQSTEAHQEIEILTNSKNQIQQASRVKTDAISRLNTRLQKIGDARERIVHINGDFQKKISEVNITMDELGVKLEDVLRISITLEPLNKAEEVSKLEKELIIKEREENERAFNEVQIKIDVIKQKLDEPNLKYQKYKESLREWENNLQKIQGSYNDPNSLLGVKKKINEFDNDLPTAYEELINKREEISKEIFNEIENKKWYREKMYEPAQKAILENTLIREDMQLEFRSPIAINKKVFIKTLFSMVKRTSGQLRGDDTENLLRRLLPKKDTFFCKNLIESIKNIHKVISEAECESSKLERGLRSVIKKESNAEAVYNYLYGLSYVDVKYSIKFQDLDLEQLSPGQRGLLLLIFYLLVDTERKPLILDQPEENLDNETIVSILVPALEKAKERRQIIIVTHNPNLAVYCDAEQIIYSSFDRVNQRIKYVSGSIENPEINAHVINVLEGTKPAFDNRGGKYM